MKPVKASFRIKLFDGFEEVKGLVYHIDSVPFLGIFNGYYGNMTTHIPTGLALHLKPKVEKSSLNECKRFCEFLISRYTPGMISDDYETVNSALRGASSEWKKITERHDPVRAVRVLKRE